MGVGKGEGAYILSMFSDTISRQTGLHREPQPTTESTEKGYKETWKIKKKKNQAHYKMYSSNESFTQDLILCIIFYHFE